MWRQQRSVSQGYCVRVRYSTTQSIALPKVQCQPKCSDTNCVTSMNQLAIVLRDLGKYEQAEGDDSISAQAELQPCWESLPRRIKLSYY
jgi:hypothetical protein